MGEFVIGIGIIVMFVMQLLCFRIRKPWGRWIPLALILLGELYCAGEYFGIYPWCEGYWNELSGAILAMFVGLLAIGVAVGWIVHILHHWWMNQRGIRDE
ncbi:MAG: hypothetical protein IJ486_04960 [Firmicutes bacterium]|nr:hypothetical protein [Bacillota bacterium]